MLFNYSHNNSRGNWWLAERHWIALERAGWNVEWMAKEHIGARSTRASKDFTSFRQCIKEFEHITGQCVTDNGCPCCGPPHSFSWEDEDGEFHYCSGERCSDYIYEDDLSAYRETGEQLSNGISNGIIETITVGVDGASIFPEWRTDETTPRDIDIGKILVLTTDNNISTAHYDHLQKKWVVDSIKYKVIKAWMPFPAIPPDDKEEENDEEDNED